MERSIFNGRKKEKEKEKRGRANRMTLDERNLGEKLH